VHIGQRGGISISESFTLQEAPTCTDWACTPKPQPELEGETLDDVIQTQAELLSAETPTSKLTSRTETPPAGSVNSAAPTLALPLPGPGAAP
jgi:hypothetical protein